ncbi:MAG: LysR family transcriptional regulator [Pseudomonadota bacterium]
MEMNQIRYFLAVCEHRNFTHAARASNVSQPSLTASIKKLEAELNGPLFLRDRAGCRLTPLGSLIKPRLQKILSETAEAKADAIRHIRLERVPISVGMGLTIGQSRVVEATRAHRVHHPEVDIEFIVAAERELLEGLREGRFDVAISPAEPSEDLYRMDALYTEPYRVAVSTQHPLASEAAVTLDRLANTDMIDRPNCEMRDLLHSTCAEAGHSLYAAFRSNQVDWLLALVRSGAGAAILPATAIPDEPDLLSLPIDGVDFKRTVYGLRYRHQPPRPEADALLRVLAQAD